MRHVPWFAGAVTAAANRRPPGRGLQQRQQPGTLHDERPRSGETIAATVDDINSYRLSVVGPDPFTARNWYATVKIHNGQIRVS
jgi:hypothetical protein